MNTKLLNESQAAELLNIKRETLATWRSTGRYNLPFIKVGRTVRYREADLVDWLDKRTQRHTAEGAAA